MNQGIMACNKINDAKDIFPYIDEPKKILKFSNINTIKNGTYINVKVPNSLTKRDLYSVAKKFQVDYYSNIILSINNYLLKDDDTYIEGIQEGSIINIIEDVDFPDGSFYKTLMKKYENENKIQFIFQNQCVNLIEFPKNITVPEMIKATFSKLKLNSKSSRINELNILDNSKINKFFNYQKFTISKSDPLTTHWKFGKTIIAKIIELDNDSNYKPEIYIGTLNSIKQLIYNIENIFLKELKKLYIGEMEYGKKDIKSLNSIGINEDFECKVKLGKNILYSKMEI